MKLPFCVLRIRLRSGKKFDLVSESSPHQTEEENFTAMEKALS